ncbi:ribonuclease P/MRP protein subunit POP5 isoform X1 [Pleurodeles waltl]|uniref:ribonuclease P/MRP protein subunit POP5 isoform X1 n=1 Tax=Pleurodeles waltl TaxID=8319 RepID=UPI003709904D
MVKFKSRYLLCEVVLADPLERKNITQELVLYNLKDAVIRLHGDFGWAACTISLSVKYLNAYTGVVLIRCRKEFFQLLWSALPFITCLVGRNRQYPCFFNTLHVGGVLFVELDMDSSENDSGTIRTSQKFLIQYNQQQLLVLLRKCTSQEERDSVQRSIMSCSLVDEEKEYLESEEEGVETE